MFISGCKEIIDIFYLSVCLAVEASQKFHRFFIFHPRPLLFLVPLSVLEDLILHVEALIFASEQSISAQDICPILLEVHKCLLSQEEVERMIAQIKEKYDRPQFALTLVALNGGYQFLTKPPYYNSINQLQVNRSKRKLSQAAMETLSIIAYRQPVTKLEIEQIRGVNCDYTIQKLLEKELISICGKSESIGKPLLYGTSKIFMDYFGINTYEDLPQLKDLPTEINEIGKQHNE